MSNGSKAHRGRRNNYETNPGTARITAALDTMRLSHATSRSPQATYRNRSESVSSYSSTGALTLSTPTAAMSETDSRSPLACLEVARQDEDARSDKFPAAKTAYLAARTVYFISKEEAEEQIKQSRAAEAKKAAEVRKLMVACKEAQEAMWEKHAEDKRLANARVDAARAAEYNRLYVFYDTAVDRRDRGRGVGYRARGRGDGRRGHHEGRGRRYDSYEDYCAAHPYPDHCTSSGFGSTMDGRGDRHEEGGRRDEEGGRRYQEGGQRHEEGSRRNEGRRRRHAGRLPITTYPTHPTSSSFGKTTTRSYDYPESDSTWIDERGYTYK